MYAVVESGGKQYKVEEGTSLLVDRLDAKEGDKVALRPVLFRGDDVVAGAERAGEGQSRGESRRAPARAEDQSLQIQGEEGLPPPRRPPLRADQARGDRGTRFFADGVGIGRDHKIFATLKRGGIKWSQQYV